MSKFIVWFLNEGVEDFTIVTASDRDDASDVFSKLCGMQVISIREIDMDDNSYLAYV